MRNARDVLSWPCRLRSTWAWLRTWITLTKATSAAITATITALPRLRLGRLEIGHLQARIERREREVGRTAPAQAELELALALAEVAQARRVAEQALHLAPVTDGDERERRMQWRTLVDDDIAARAAEARHRREPP